MTNAYIARLRISNLAKGRISNLMNGQKLPRNDLQNSATKPIGKKIPQSSEPINGELHELTIRENC
jgi:hypothetical protein